MGKNNIRNVIYSSLPRSIPAISIHFAPSGSGANVPLGPIIGPNPGPILLRALAAAERHVETSISYIPSPMTSKPKLTIYRAKKVNTDIEMLLSIGLPLYVGGNIPWGRLI